MRTQPHLVMALLPTGDSRIWDSAEEAGSAKPTHLPRLHLAFRVFRTVTLRT
jgi:hypothetical protein